MAVKNRGQANINRSQWWAQLAEKARNPAQSSHATKLIVKKLTINNAKRGIFARTLKFQVVLEGFSKTH